MLDVEATMSLFLDREAVLQRVDAGVAKVFREVGYDWRDHAKKQIKRARQKTLAEMTAEELEVHEVRKRIAKEEGRRAKKPLASSEPGDSPRSVTGLLRKHQYFALDQNTDSLVMGAAKLNSSKGDNVPEILEKGGRTKDGHYIEARPNTSTAFDKVRPSIPARFANRF